MTSSPLWRGGGRIFPNSPEENFTHKVTKKEFCRLIKTATLQRPIDDTEGGPTS